MSGGDLPLGAVGGQPEPTGGWSEEIVKLKRAVVVPPLKGDFIQPAGVLAEDGTYCAHGALWRKFRALTVMPEMPERAEPLPGRWLWGGVLWAHFGHFLVESSARLWALDQLEQPVDGILFMPRRPRAGDAVRGFHKDFIQLMAPDMPVRVVTDPASVEELVVPGQGFGLGRITAGTEAFRQAVHNRFAADIAAEGPEKIYISRSALGIGKGGLLGEERMEELLASEGYEIFHPQRHDMATQIARYKAARQIVAADGSAIHLFAMVGRADQSLAIVLRRKSSANNLLQSNVTHFCEREPLMIEALRSEWVKATNKKKSNRLSFGELDLQRIGAMLAEGGFIRDAAAWQALSDEERQALFAAKKLTGKNALEELPKYKRNRIRAARRARKAT